MYRSVAHLGTSRQSQHVQVETPPAQVVGGQPSRSTYEGKLAHLNFSTLRTDSGGKRQSINNFEVSILAGQFQTPSVQRVWGATSSALGAGVPVLSRYCTLTLQALTGSGFWMVRNSVKPWPTLPSAKYQLWCTGLGGRVGGGTVAVGSGVGEGNFPVVQRRRGFHPRSPGRASRVRKLPGHKVMNPACYLCR